MKYLLPLTWLIALLGCNSDLSGKETPEETPTISASVFEYGVYQFVNKGEIVDSPGTTTGKSVKDAVIQQVEQIDRVRIRKDTFLGYRYKIINLPAGALIKPEIELKRFLMHPEMELPDGSAKTGSERTIRRKIVDASITAVDGYAFNEDYEMVTGDWTFQIWHDDTLLVERKFTTYLPNQDSGGADTQQPAVNRDDSKT